MKKKFPILISIPHGGTLIPKIANPHVHLRLEDILEDGDTYTRDIYDASSITNFCVKTQIARAILDLNRDPFDLPPANPDGVVKTITTFNKQVWKEKSGAPSSVASFLIENYHKKYHRLLASLSKNNEIQLALDCHSMLAKAPPTSNRNDARPLLCLSNGGDSNGLPFDGPVSAPSETLFAMGNALARQFEHQDLEIRYNTPLLQYNDPFRGGYITRYHGANGKVPWVQVECSRALYLSQSKPFSTLPDEVSKQKITFLHKKFIAAITLLFS